LDRRSLVIPDKEGVLWKKGNNSGKWQDRYFLLKNDSLCYYKSKPKGAPELLTDPPTQILISGSCMVKLCVLDRLYCFQVVTPTRIYYLSAESNASMFEWMNLMKKQIQEQLNKLKERKSSLGQLGSSSGAVTSTPTSPAASPTTSPTSSPTSKPSKPMSAQDVLNKAKKKTPNKICADCGNSDSSWVDLYFGVFICTECSGIHRRLMPSAKVKSIKMGRWDPESLEQLKDLDNNKSNEKYEGNVPSYMIKPSSKDPYSTKSSWIEAKYNVKEEKPSSVLPSGPLHKEGVLLKKNEGSEQWQDYYFVLDDGYLTLSKGKTNKNGTPMDLSFMCSISESTTDKEFAFDIQTPTRMYLLKAQTKEEMDSWIQAISDAIARKSFM